MKPPNLIRRRRWLVPEVVQTSGMDCGPAVLKCLLEGYGIGIHYGRLREACQTDLDGTSVDTLEAVANRLGLMAEQVMLPADFVLLPDSKSLPAILIVRLPDGATHFVLVWRRHGPFVQVMDPSVGRRWMTCRQLISEMYTHRQQVPADAWREWAVSDEMVAPLRYRLRELGIGKSHVRQWIDNAIASSTWRAMAELDAVTRVVKSLVSSGGVSRGAAASRTIQSLLDQTVKNTHHESILPDRFWSVQPCASNQTDEADAEEQVWLRGAVLVRISGRVDQSHPQVIDDDGPTTDQDLDSESSASLGRELEVALTAAESQPLLKVWSLVRGAGALSIASLLVCLLLAAVCVVAEALLFRGILDLRRDLAITPQRLIAVGCLCLFGFGMMLLEYRIGAGLYRLGRRLEIALRVEFLSKIPRLHDRYFQSRPTSDMAERGHSLHRVRLVPSSAGQFVRAAATIMLTAAAIAWSEPAAAPYAFVAAVTAILLPILFLPMLQGLDLRVRTHSGALTRFTFDTLLGLAAVRAHVAENAVSIEHESLLVEWARSSYQLLRWRVFVDGLQSFVGICMAAWLLLIHASHSADATSVLLLAYWALSIPTLGEKIAQLVHQYPSYRNVTLRLLEPLGASEHESLAEAENAVVDLAKDPALQGGLATSTTEEPSLADESSAASICLKNVRVLAGGHVILDCVDVEIQPRSHLAIVGPSGAGKSTLVGLLLGWHRACAGQVLVDGHVLDAAKLAQLRMQTAWVDPSVQLWNRSLLDNVFYGNATTPLGDLGDVLQNADLYDVLQRLPDGMQTLLGESGGLLSGGEGQRVKLARGFARQAPRLVILDEPFRGLERSRRREMLHLARQRWESATLICITHDVSETLEFPRVLVLDQGRIVEDGSPAELNSQSDSLYKSLIDAEHAIQRGLWESDAWRRIQIKSGRVVSRTPDSGVPS